MTAPILRFAPSPNGRLHLGHAYSALLNEALARRLGGALLLRIEDIDPIRSRPDHVAAMIEDLRWLGVAWAEPVRHQSRHMDDYVTAAETLRGRGVIYACFCSRGDIRARVAELAPTSGGPPWPRDPDGAPLYPGTCRHLAPGAAAGRMRGGARPAWRLDTARAEAIVGPALSWLRFDPDGPDERVAARPGRWGDPIVVRRDIAASYHLCVVVDDALQRITHVVRGADLEPATGLHALLQRLLGLGSPRYLHHRLIRDALGEKLSKSAGSTSLAELRAAGATPGDVRRLVGWGAPLSGPR